MYQMTLFFKKVIYKNNAPIDIKLHLLQPHIVFAITVNLFCNNIL